MQSVIKGYSGYFRVFGSLPFLVALALPTASCARRGPEGLKAREVQDPRFTPEASIRSAFVITPPSTPSSTRLSTPTNSPSPLAAQGATISILKSSLEKEFLLQAELILQPLAPQFNALQSRVVYFRRVEGKKLLMIEGSQGHTEAANLPQTLVLAEFPILSETPDALAFDFNRGMSRLFESGDWQGQDMRGGNPTDGTFTEVRARFSVVEKANFSRNNTLVIQQLAQLDAPQPDGTLQDTPVRVVYFVTPYRPDAGFSPTQAPRTFDHLGFFEVATQFNSESGPVVYAAKVDVRKPIVYAISSNTPAPYRQAVRDGILYWNRALGKDLVRVVDAPVGATAPDPDFNIVQWVEWPSAGFAYADAQMDPRTGEVLHQQVYLTSAWAQIGKAETRKLLKEITGTPRSPTPATIGLRGFRPQKLCSMDLNAAIVDGLSLSLARKRDPNRVLKAAQDLIRLVVAHEVGHTLGLRHNFAGSLAANYSLDQREDLFKAYLDTGKSKEGLVTSSSVMDYQYPLESILSGDQISRGLPAYDYDHKAMQYLYFGATYKPSELPLFCTDSQTTDYPDCKPYDAGHSFVGWTRYQLHDELANLPWVLLQSYISAKCPLYGERPLPLDQVQFDAKAKAASYLAPERTFMSLFVPESQLLRTSREFPFVNSSNRDEVRARESEYLQSEFSREGDLSSILMGADPDFSKREYGRFEALLADETNLKGNSPDGKPYEFTPEDVAVMKATVRTFYQALQTELIRDEARILAGHEPSGQRSSSTPSEAERFDAGSLGDLLGTYLFQRSSEYVMRTTGTPWVLQNVTVTTGSTTAPRSGTAPGSTASPENQQVTSYSLPQFAYPFDVRLRAASFLDPSRSESPTWMIKERGMEALAFETLVKRSFPLLDFSRETTCAMALQGGPQDPLTPFEDLPPDALRWVTEAIGVKCALSSAPAGS